MDENTYSRSFVKKKPILDGRKRKTIIIVALIVVAAVLLLFNSFYELNEDEYAVITTFGKPSVVSTPGLKFKVPFIQQKKIVSKATKGFAIGYDIKTNATLVSEAVMITVDYNFVDVDFSSSTTQTFHAASRSSPWNSTIAISSIFGFR